MTERQLAEQLFINAMNRYRPGARKDEIIKEARSAANRARIGLDILEKEFPDEPVNQPGLDQVVEPPAKPADAR